MLPLLLALACAAPLHDGFFTGDARGVPVEVASGGSARLGEAFVPGGPNHLYSVSNDNTRYVLQVRHEAPLQPDWAFLRLGERTLKAQAVGSEGRAGIAEFQLSRADADAAAALLAIPRRDREPLDEGLSATFRANPAAPGGPAPIVLHIEKAAGPEVALVTGGAAGSGRDARFSFEVTLDGEPVEIPRAIGFGSPRVPMALRPGDSVELTADLAQWVDLSTPGVYSVRCRYAGELEVADGVRDVASYHKRWDFVVSGEISLSVAPAPG